MKTRLILLAVLAVVAGACSGSADTTTSTTSAATTTTTVAPTTTEPGSTTTSEADLGYSPRFVADDCAFNVPIGTSPQCGYLVVPEDRTDPTGPEVRIHVAVFDATGTDPASDPLIYLDGGPGGHTLDTLEYAFETSYAPLLEDRDLILFDQRGVGRSEPALDCPEERAVQIDYLDDDVSDDEYAEAVTDALAACRDRLIADGVDLAAYNSAANAADVADLRVALGFDEVNLWGISYGTRLALTIMRDRPEGIRSVVLDSTVPIQLDLYPAIPASADRAFDLLFDGCASDARCAATYPNLEAGFLALVETLDADPAEITVDDFVTGESYPGIVRGSDLYGLMFQSLYGDTIIPLLPDFIADGVAGDYGGIERLSSLFFTNGPFISSGMYLSVQCNEEYVFSSPDEVADAVAQHPDVAEMFGSAESEFDDCAMWGAGEAAPIENEPVASAIPTLVLAGEYDPITPPEYGRSAASTLANSFFFEFPGLAHGVTTADECPTTIFLSFLQDPTAGPDGSCIGTMSGPEFFIPGDVSITLVPFEEDIYGFTVAGIRPEEWDHQGFGVFSAPGLGDILIFQQTVPSGIFSVDQMVDQLSTQFELPNAWDRRGHDDGTRDWDVYLVEDGGLFYDLALHDDGTTLFIVMLITTDDVRAQLVDDVLYPALEAVNAG